MYKIIYHINQMLYTVHQNEITTGKDVDVFESRDVDAVLSYCNKNIGIPMRDMESGLDLFIRLGHNIMEFGFNKRLVITYTLDN